MSMTFQSFTKLLTENSANPIHFYLPNGEQIPAHFHITDVGKINRQFIDCGAEIRTENWVQLQLWLGKDSDHRLNSGQINKILQHSDKVLSTLLNLHEAEVVIEYQIDLISSYTISRAEAFDNVLHVYLASRNTDCLAKVRHQQAQSSSSIQSEKSACC